MKTLTWAQALEILPSEFKQQIYQQVMNKAAEVQQQQQSEEMSQSSVVKEVADAIMSKI
jgi:hypothetical protein